MTEPTPPPPPPPAVTPEPPREAGLEATAARTSRARAAVENALEQCRGEDCGVLVRSGVVLEDVTIEGETIVVRLSRDMGDGPVRPAGLAQFRSVLEDAIRPAYPNRLIRIQTRGADLEALIPNTEREDPDTSRLFAPTIEGPPLVRRPGSDLEAGLSGRHVAMWPSHGWYYNSNGGPGAPGDGLWGWQRARLFTSVEDLLTVGFVTRELAPMFERAGAVTLLPRERDVALGVTVDDGVQGYSEAGSWSDGPAGFLDLEAYGDRQNPFVLGTSRTGQTGAVATWRPAIPASGMYAVHVSYSDVPGQTDSARYLVNHAGGQTEVLVNQTMGAGTWVYLGTWEFEAGLEGAVSLVGDDSGTVSADAVRFGGGVGVIERGGGTSGKPRWIEAARYYEQYSGAPTYVYNSTGELDDYTDDYRSRGEWVAWLRGAPYGPTGRRDDPGLGIPVDASLAWHTDAGQTRRSLVGTLMIYDVPGMDSTRTFANGTSRLANRDLADGVQTSIVEDVRALYNPDWPRRPMWDRNYSEAARPTVPGILLELLSHHNYRDMRHALDPRFRFDAARAVYKGMGRFMADQRGDVFVPQPLRPTHLAAVLEADAVTVRWQPQADALEADAIPTSYRVEMRDGAWGWTEAAMGVDATEIRLPVPARGVVRSYRVVALNAGGESRPSAVVAVGRALEDGPSAIVIDGFDRVAAPHAIDERGRAGFTEPVGVPEGLGVITVGTQRLFDPSVEFVSDAQPGWGASGRDLEGTAIMGNDRDHVAAYGDGLLAAGLSFSSASDEAIEDGTVALDADAVVLALGLERRTDWPNPEDPRPPSFEALPTALRDRLGRYLEDGGALVVSGAHWASDAAEDPASRAWVRDVLGVEAGGKVEESALEVGGATVPYVRDYNPARYPVRSSDVLEAAAGETAFTYPNGRVAAVRHGRVLSVGVPLDAVFEDEGRGALIRDALRLVLRP